MNKDQVYEAVSVKVNKARVPVSFFWRNRAYRVDAIERIWRNTQGKQRGLRLYRIRSRQQAFLLLYDQRLNHWLLVRSPWRLRLSLAVSGLASRLAA